jgi:arylformamidase
MRIWDISEPIEPATAPFPGDTPFSQEWVLRQEQGGSCNVSTIRMSVHVGTHTDSPLHFDVAGPDIASVDLRRYLGRCRVVDVRGVGSPSLIPAAAITPAMLAGAERILFRTRERHDHRTWNQRFYRGRPRSGEGPGGGRHPARWHRYAEHGPPGQQRTRWPPRAL